MSSPVLLKRLLLTVAAGLLAGCVLINNPNDITAREELYNLIISEIHYNPLPSGQCSSDSLEFIEIFNGSGKEISLKQVAFDDGISYSFSSEESILHGEYIVLASCAECFETKYGFPPHGEFSGNLKNSGERIALKDMSKERVFLSIEYSDKGPWPEKADGLGYSLVPLSTSPGFDLTDARNWRASACKNGSPGRADPSVVYVNEVLTHTDPPQQDAIELFNPGLSPVDISGWYLTDDKSTPAKFRIPDGTVIEAKGYLVFYHSDFSAAPSLPYPFSLSANGEEVYLFSDPSDPASSFSHGFSFDAIENSVSFGRYVNSSGQERFTTFSELTLGKANSDPYLSQVVITEIMYNPPNGRDEYVEIKNCGSETVSLFDEGYPENTWILKGFGFAFPQGVSLKSEQRALIITDTIPAEEFRSLYDVPEDVPIFSGASGGLRNSGDTLTLMSPEEPFLDGIKTVVPYKVVERVEYSDKGLWPVSADGGGKSLIRKNTDQFSDDPANWMAGNPSPGR